MTTSEYDRLDRSQKIVYRLPRHPGILLLIIPTYLFLFQQHLPVGFLRSGWDLWINTMMTNLSIVVVVVILVSLIGHIPFLLIHGPVVLIGATIGIWLFYVQHQFERTYWRKAGDWNFHDAAWLGSSHYDLPQPLRWLTANIGIHHVHHLSCRIPFYRLGEVLHDWPELRDVNRITISDSFRGLRSALWDEKSARLVSFADAADRVARSKERQ